MGRGLALYLQGSRLVAAWAETIYIYIEVRNKFDEITHTSYRNMYVYFIES